MDHPPSTRWTTAQSFARRLREPEVKDRCYRRPAGSTQLTPYAEALRQALTADARRPKREQRTAKALFEDVKAHGYVGGYSRLTDFVRAWRAEGGEAATRKAFVPLVFGWVEAYQFDWSEEGVVVGDVYYRAQVAHMTLCASRAFWLVYARDRMIQATAPNIIRRGALLDASGTKKHGQSHHGYMIQGGMVTFLAKAARSPAPRTPRRPGRHCTVRAWRGGCLGRPRWWWCSARR